MAHVSCAPRRSYVKAFSGVQDFFGKSASRPIRGKAGRVGTWQRAPVVSYRTPGLVLWGWGSRRGFEWGRALIVTSGARSGFRAARCGPLRTRTSTTSLARVTPLARLHAGHVRRRRRAGSRTNGPWVFSLPDAFAVKKAVAYLRTSSRTNVGADKDSDKRQRAAIDAYAKASGYEIVATFYDAAVSGAEGPPRVARRE